MRRLVWAATLLLACGGGQGARSPSTEAGAGGACGPSDALMDLDAAMRTPAAFGASSDVYYLIDTDEELGYARMAQTSLVAATSPDAGALATEVERLVSVLEARRAELAQGLGTLEKTSGTAEAALDAAAMCEQIDMRVTETTASKAVIASKRCEPAVRLWSSARYVDLTTDVTSRSIASHITELALDKDRAAVRDRLAIALKDHAQALKSYHLLANPKPEEQDASAQALVALHTDLHKSIENLDRVCMPGSTQADRVVGGNAELRRVTVTVRPRWPGTLAALARPEEFGSGFVVKWRNTNGQLETRIVTNNHVMDGAFEADIVPGDPTEASRGKDAAKWSAALIQANPHDDVAILRLDGPAAATFAQGVSFRLSPAKEQEQVVAAGFPGVGVRPSFQVSRGTVSNARFGAEEEDADPRNAYVQHTAAIDPGNSGGPLLDADGRLLGMNTLKIVGRENVGLAIPTSRIEQALIRAEHAPKLHERHAQASCNAVVAALASPHPPGAAMSRFSLALYEASQAGKSDTNEATYRERVQGQATNPIDEARLLAYASVRARVEQEHGVRPFEMCSDVKADGRGDSFVGTFHTRERAHTLTFIEEHGTLRLASLE